MINHQAIQYLRLKPDLIDIRYSVSLRQQIYDHSRSIQVGKHIYLIYILKENKKWAKDQRQYTDTTKSRQSPIQGIHPPNPCQIISYLSNILNYSLDSWVYFYADRQYGSKFEERMICRAVKAFRIIEGYIVRCS
jgi:hypothetical protein